MVDLREEELDFLHQQELDLHYHEVQVHCELWRGALSSGCVVCGRTCTCGVLPSSSVSAVPSLPDSKGDWVVVTENQFEHVLHPKEESEDEDDEKKEEEDVVDANVQDQKFHDKDDDDADPASLKPTLPDFQDEDDDQGVVNAREVDLSVEELSELLDVRGFVQMLHDFALQVTKKDGRLYPPGSIQNLLRAIGRVIRRRQEQRITRMSIPEIPCDIFRDVQYRKVKHVEDQAVNRSFKEGLGTRASSSDILTMEEEQMVLTSHGASLSHPLGVNNRFGYFCCCNMFNRGKDELRSTTVQQFELMEFNGKELLRHG